MSEIAVIMHNIRSAHNVGAILRTADGFGVTACYFTGYTPYPTQSVDDRLPHISQKITAAIHKTALGAENTVHSSHVTDIQQCISQLSDQGYVIVGLEQDATSIPLRVYRPPERIALLIGEEVAGIQEDLRHKCAALLEIPMKGKKESFNVSVATGIALYELSKA